MGRSMLAPPAAEAWAFCRRVLPDVSRTFALNIPVLPARLRDSVCCAYLLCRIADTIEDSEHLAAAQREGLYDALAEAVSPEEGVAARRAFPTGWAASGGVAPGYAELVDGSAAVLAAFETLPEADRRAIAACVREMIDGMRRLGGRRPEGGVRFVCEDFGALDRYCHYVAGTVGVMLTRLFALELGGPAALTSADGVECGRRFGLGLQATNIIKDHADDVARGVCFVPRSCVGSAGEAYAIRPERRAELIAHALGHLDEAGRFVLRVPAAAEGIRLFCLWALMLALGTLREAVRARARTPKVARDEVATIIDTSRRLVSDDAGLRAWMADYRGQVTAAMGAA